MHNTYAHWFTGALGGQAMGGSGSSPYGAALDSPLNMVFMTLSLVFVCSIE